jgi:hypothetical protein
MPRVYSEGVINQPVSGTEDDDDDRDDEHTRENEAPIREVNDQTEAPEEFKVDDEDEDEDEAGHVKDHDVDDEAEGE